MRASIGWHIMAENKTGELRSMNKKNLVALFGGQSSEHVVSCMSVQNVAANIDRDLYNVYLVGITEEGRWLLVDSEKEMS